MNVFGFDNFTDKGVPISNIYGDEISGSYGFLIAGKNDYQKEYAVDTVDNLIKTNTNFIYFIDGKPDPHFSKFIKLSDELIDYAKKGKCKICINAMTEYFYGRYITHNMNVIANEYGLDSSNLIFITGNLIAKNEPEDMFSYISFNYFLDYPWFVNKDNIKVLPENHLLIDRKILCYNRRPHVHRKILVYEILNNPTILNNIKLSYGGATNKFKFGLHNFLEKIEDVEKAHKINRFFESMEFEINIDHYNLEYNLADNFDYEMHYRTFISLVSETNVNSDNLFFSEKTYKPIYAKQPFIIYGNPHSLKYLKGLGFKTFDNWFDESYDDEVIFEKRLNKIMSLLETISKMDIGELQQIREEMKPILEHNYELFFKLSDLNNFLNKLSIPKKI